MKHLSTKWSKLSNYLNNLGNLSKFIIIYVPFLILLNVFMGVFNHMQVCVWLANVTSVDVQAHSAKVEFFVPLGSQGLYRPERAGSRARQEDISWDSVLSIASGCWNGSLFRPTEDVGHY